MWNWKMANFWGSCSRGVQKIIACVIIESNSCLCKLFFITLHIILGDQEKVIWLLETVNNRGKLCHFIHSFHLIKALHLPTLCPKTLSLCSWHLLSVERWKRKQNMSIHKGHRRFREVLRDKVSFKLRPERWVEIYMK